MIEDFRDLRRDFKRRFSIYMIITYVGVFATLGLVIASIFIES